MLGFDLQVPMNVKINIMVYSVHKNFYFQENTLCIEIMSRMKN